MLALLEDVDGADRAAGSPIAAATRASAPGRRSRTTRSVSENWALGMLAMGEGVRSAQSESRPTDNRAAIGCVSGGWDPIFTVVASSVIAFALLAAAVRRHNRAAPPGPDDAGVSERLFPEPANGGYDDRQYHLNITYPTAEPIRPWKAR